MAEFGKMFFSKEFLDNWHSNYRKLEEFYKSAKSGDRITGELARWVDHQREIQHLLPPDLTAKLALVEIDLENRGSTWDIMFKQLSLFVQQFGHAFVPADHENEALRDWLIRQTLAKNLLSKTQFEKLDKLNVDWDITMSRDQRWELMYARLQDFHAVFGHSRVPQKWNKDPQLALWVQVQRRMHTQGKLRKYREQKLREVDFVWSIKTIFDSQWKQKFEELEAFYKKNGHTRVPGKNSKLVGWMERQRLAKSTGQLSAERLKKLEGIGFIWNFQDIKEQAWEQKFNELKQFRQEHGHAFVPVNYKENKPLGTWVASQRWLEAKGKLKPGKKRKLTQLGFVWSKDTEKKLKAINDEKWEASFKQLKAYKNKYGTCQVSLKVNKVLQRWTCWQRKAFYEGKLSQERMDRLNEIRFPWSIQEGYWMKMYDALIDFKNKFGHTRVPFQWSKNHKLADWVYRTRVNKGSLEIQKIELLDDIGFDWSLVRRNVVPWKEMYGRLTAFKQKHGHTKVPVKWQEDLKLGKWVSRMRNERETLDPERVALLEAIEFDWGYRFSKQEKQAEYLKQ